MKSISIGGRVFLALLALLTGIGAGPARAQIKGQAPGQPDILVLVFAGGDGPAQIGLTYPGLVPHDQVRKDLDALRAATGWTLSGINISDKLPPIRTSLGKMTESDFTVADALPPAEHVLPVEPFVDAFRTRRHLALTYFVAPGYQFSGPLPYRDSHVRIDLDHRGSTFTYQIFIHDGHFGRLNLQKNELAGARTRTVEGSGGRAINPWLLAVIAFAAVGTGCVVYAVVARSA